MTRGNGHGGKYGSNDCHDHHHHGGGYGDGCGG